MNVIITVFGGDNSDVIIVLESRGFAPFIDGLHSNDIPWLKKQFKQDHRFYEVVNGSVVEYTSFIIDDSCKPNMAITLCEGEIPPPLFWHSVGFFVREMFGLHEGLNIACELGESMMKKPERNLKIDLDEYDHLPEFDGKVGKWEANAAKNGKPVELMTEGVVYRMKNEPPEVVGGYFLDTFPLEDLNIMIYQVIKPGLKDPICIVVRNFTEHGHKRFFADIFGSEDWHRNNSTDRFDIPFLCDQWKQLGLEGEFSEDVVTERILGCTPTASKLPDAEPEIYRRGMQEVMERLKMANAPCNHAIKKKKGKK